MSQYIREYNPDKVNVSWGDGTLPLRGFADGTFITMTRANPRTDATVGAHGDVAITKTADRTGTVEITLLQNSPSNVELSAIVNTEDAAKELFRSSFVVEDPNGGVIARAKRCHIQEPAAITLGDGQNAKVWVFFAEDIEYLTLPAGMNTSPVADVVTVVEAVRSVSEQLKTITS